MEKKKPVCDCAAYPFPHRELGGKCSEESIAEHVVKKLEEENDYDWPTESCGRTWAGYWNYSPENFGGSRR